MIVTNLTPSHIEIRKKRAFLANAKPVIITPAVRSLDFMMNFNQRSRRETVC